MTQTPAPETSAPKAAFAIEGVPVQTPARIAWGLGIGELALGVLGLVALLVAALGAPAVVVLALGVVLALLVALGVRTEVAQPLPPAGLGGLGRLLVVAAALLLVAGAPATRWSPLLLLGAAVVAEVAYASVTKVAVPFSSHLPGIDVRPAARFRPRWVGYAGAAAAVLVLVFVLLPLPVWPAWVVAAAALLLAGAALVDAATWVLQRRRGERRLNRTLTAYAPRFALHWDAQPGTGYQIGRWIPYLDRLGVRYVVFVRNPASFAEAERLTDQPVLVRRMASTYRQGGGTVDLRMLPPFGTDGHTLYRWEANPLTQPIIDVFLRARGLPAMSDDQAFDPVVATLVEEDKQLVTYYLRMPTEKALAVPVDHKGGVYLAYARRSVKEAREQALYRCQTISRGDCELVAENMSPIGRWKSPKPGDRGDDR